MFPFSQLEPTNILDSGRGASVQQDDDGTSRTDAVFWYLYVGTQHTALSALKMMVLLALERGKMFRFFSKIRFHKDSIRCGNMRAVHP